LATTVFAVAGTVAVDGRTVESYGTDVGSEAIWSEKVMACQSGPRWAGCWSPGARPV